MKIVTQVLDSTYGKSAVGVHVSLERSSGSGWTTIAEAVTDDEGYIENWNGDWPLERGLYRMVFDSDSYFAGLGASTAYPEVIVTFRTTDGSSTFQVRIMLSPYSYSTFFETLGSLPVCTSFRSFRVRPGCPAGQGWRGALGVRPEKARAGAGRG